MVSEDFANSIATDKFCAGSIKGKLNKQIIFTRITSGLLSKDSFFFNFYIKA